MHANCQLEGEARINVLDRLANIYYESRKWAQAEANFKDVIRGFLKHGRHEDDDAIVEISWKVIIFLWSIAPL